MTIYRWIQDIGIYFWVLMLLTSKCCCSLMNNENVVKFEIKDKSPSCKDEAADYIDRCMDPFVKEIKPFIQGKAKSKQKMWQGLFTGYYCTNYEEVLLCLHNVLKLCDTDDANNYVQQRLGVPWIPKINKMCDINVKKANYTKTTTDSNATESKVVISPSQREHLQNSIHSGKYKLKDDKLKTVQSNDYNKISLTTAEESNIYSEERRTSSDIPKGFSIFKFSGIKIRKVPDIKYDVNHRKSNVSILLRYIKEISKSAR